MLRKIYIKVNSFIEKHILIMFLVTLVIARYENFIWFLKQVKHFLVFGLGFDKYPVMDFSNIGVFSSLLLAFVTIWLALNANKTANESKKISEKALEIERPNLKVDYISPKQSEPDLYRLNLKNSGTVDAVNIQIFQSLENSKLSLIYRLDYLTPNTQDYFIDFSPNNDFIVFVLQYENQITGKTYKSVFEIKKTLTGVYQLGNFKKQIISYSDYLNL